MDLIMKYRPYSKTCQYRPCSNKSVDLLLEYYQAWAQERSAW